MSQLLVWWRHLYHRSPFAWALVSYVAVYLVFSALMGDVWLRMWLKGNAYMVYQLTFLVSFVLVYGLVLRKLHTRTLGVPTWAAIGTVIGYLCRLIGYFAITLAMPGGEDRLFRHFERSAGIESLMILVVPAILLNWLLGLVMGLLTRVAARPRQGAASGA